MNKRDWRVLNRQGVKWSGHEDAAPRVDARMVEVSFYCISKHQCHILPRTSLYISMNLMIEQEHMYHQNRKAALLSIFHVIMKITKQKKITTISYFIIVQQAIKIRQIQCQMKTLLNGFRVFVQIS
ncbi:Hypothetical_protein [Hexamita inflata]|uniref:Hypothetical_protein n=1 Tax=Hexamita inflata TaxID=28002 RepID=A0AA86RE86_9EUKA|nr:Hypothetical protein HINF_LOCUS59198 [Hexamita inflata]